MSGASVVLAPHTRTLAANILKIDDGIDDGGLLVREEKGQLEVFEDFISK